MAENKFPYRCAEMASFNALGLLLQPSQLLPGVFDFGLAGVGVLPEGEPIQG